MAFASNFNEALELVKGFYDKALSNLEEQKKLTSVDYPQPLNLLGYKVNFPEVYTKSFYNAEEFFTINSDSFYKNKPKSEEDWITRGDNFLKQLDQLEKELAPIYAENIDIIVHNKKVIQRIHEVMKAFGIPNSYKESYYPSSRSINPKTRTVDAGFVDDIRKNIKVYDKHYETIKERIKTRRKQIQEAVKTFSLKSREQEEALKKEEEKLKNEKILATLRVKYDTEYDAEVSEILDKIFSKSKYLRLGDSMLNTRRDFSRYEEVGIALVFLDHNIDPDKEIIENVMNCLDNWDGDGRIFRDTLWNYDKLFTLVPEDLYNDYDLLRGMINEW